MDITWIKSALARFTEVWQFDDFWKRGNTFHAFLRFADAALRRWPNDPVAQDIRSLRATMLAANTEYFLQKYQQPIWWADDYSWWGITFLSAREYLLAEGNQSEAARQLKLAGECFAQMMQRGYDTSSTARPVPHGCANSPQPTPDGTKNSVTNSNLLLLSLRLYLAVKSVEPPAAKPYLNMVALQYGWFEAWFTNNSGYLRTVIDRNGMQIGLLLERPMGEPDYEQRDHPPWEPGWVWSGDQGLICAGLAELYQARQELQSAGVPVSADLLTRSLQLLAGGAFELLFGRNDKVLREPPFTSTFGPDYAGDYVCGRGVMLRYLSEPSVQRTLGFNFFPVGVAATAQAVWTSRNTRNNQFAASWTGDDSAFNQDFRKAWGYGDPGTSWSTPFLDGVLQAMGLDVLAAALSS